MTDAFTPAAIHIVQGEPIARASHEDALAVLNSPGLRSIIAKRINQIQKHGHTAAHDMMHDQAEIALGAKSFLDTYIDLALAPDRRPPAGEVPVSWPWRDSEWKEPDATEPAKRECLINAIALAWAELDRIDSTLDLISAARPLTASTTEN